MEDYIDKDSLGIAASYLNLDDYSPEDIKTLPISIINSLFEQLRSKLSERLNISKGSLTIKDLEDYLSIVQAERKGHSKFNAIYKTGNLDLITYYEPYLESFKYSKDMGNYVKYITSPELVNHYIYVMNGSIYVLIIDILQRGDENLLQYISEYVDYDWKPLMAHLPLFVTNMKLIPMLFEAYPLEEEKIDRYVLESIIADNLGFLRFLIESYGYDPKEAYKRVLLNPGKSTRMIKYLKSLM